MSAYDRLVQVQLRKAWDSADAGRKAAEARCAEQAAVIERVRAAVADAGAFCACDDVRAALGPAPAQAEPDDPAGMSVKELCEAYDKLRLAWTERGVRATLAEARVAELERELDTARRCPKDIAP